MNEFTILGAGLSGRLAKYMLGDSAVLVGKLKKKSVQGCFYVHEKLDETLTQEKIKITKTVVGLTPQNFQQLKQAYLEKTGRSRDSESSFGQGKAEGWILNEEALPAPDELGYAGRVDLEKKQIFYSGDRELNFSTLINTISLPDFLELCLVPFPSDSFRSYRIGLESSPAPGRENFWINYYPAVRHFCFRSTAWKGQEILEYSEATLGEEKFAEIHWDNILEPGKILPEPLAKYYLEILKNFGVWCLGRYACWEPRMMVHDVYKILQDFERLEILK